MKPTQEGLGCGWGKGHWVRAWYYKLEDIDNRGTGTFHGPVLGIVGDAAVKGVKGTGTVAEGDTATGMGEIGIKSSGKHTITTGRYEDNPVGRPHSHRPAITGSWM